MAKGWRASKIVTTKNGKTTVRVESEPEWRHQAECVRQIKRHVDYGRRFLLAGDMNAGKRNGTMAKATGVTAGEPDLRLYVIGGTLRMIEYKAGNGKLTTEQKERHAALRALGFEIETVHEATPEDAARVTLALLNAWLDRAPALREAA